MERNLILWVWHFFILENRISFWKIAGNQIENKAEIQSVQSKQCSSHSQLIEKYEATWIFPTPIFPTHHHHHCSQKHNIFMKTCTKQKRSRFKFKVLHCWNWNVFFASTWCVLVFPPTQFFVRKTVDFLSELLDFLMHWNGKIFWW